MSTPHHPQRKAFPVALPLVKEMLLKPQIWGDLKNGFGWYVDFFGMIFGWFMDGSWMILARNHAEECQKRWTNMNKSSRKWTCVHVSRLNPSQWGSYNHFFQGGHFHWRGATLRWMVPDCWRKFPQVYLFFAPALVLVRQSFHLTSGQCLEALKSWTSMHGFKPLGIIFVWWKQMKSSTIACMSWNE